MEETSDKLSSAFQFVGLKFMYEWLNNTNPNIIGKKKLANLVHAAHFLVNRIRYAPS
jgi:hypothetical protein